jgi:hypothetical protein
MREDRLALEGAALDGDAPLASDLARVARLLTARLLPRLAPGDPVVDAARTLLDELATARSGDGAAPLDRLMERLALSPVERDLAVLAGLAEEHEILSGLFRALNPRGEPRPTVGLAAQLLCDDLRERALLRRTLELGAAVVHGLIVLAGDAPFFERNLQLPEALWSALHGLDTWPEAAVFAAVGGAPSALGPGIDGWLDEPLPRRGAKLLAAAGPCTVVVTAPSEELALVRAVALARAAGLAAAPLTLAASQGDLPPAIALHALARGVVPILRGAAREAPAVAAPRRRTADHPGPVLIAAGPGFPGLPGSRTTIVVPAEPLTSLARREMWRALLPELEPHVVALAGRYSLEPHQAHDVATDARRAATLAGRDLHVDDVETSVRVRCRVGGSAGVKVISPRADWTELVLPADRLRQLREAIDRLVHQASVLDQWGFLAGRPGARGVRMLFAGPSGTGKTFSAEVMARALGVDLLLVDISRVVSKWVGETEKNLSDVFDAAERAQAVLLFDEADALFGKRTEVSDAHDRYANLETAYLLSRIERFEGLTILSTNLRQNIDPAFVRRIEFVVDFEEPALDERQRLWRAHVPEQAPLDPAVSFPDLAAAYPVVGGVIRNAAVAAGFLAAAEGAPVSRHHFVSAIRREYEKLGRAFPGLPRGWRSHQESEHGDPRRLLHNGA